MSGKHYSTKTGRLERCRAKQRCPYGGGGSGALTPPKPKWASRYEDQQAYQAARRKTQDGYRREWQARQRVIRATEGLSAGDKDAARELSQTVSTEALSELHSHLSSPKGKAEWQEAVALEGREDLGSERVGQVVVRARALRSPSVAKRHTASPSTPPVKHEGRLSRRFVKWAVRLFERVVRG